MATKSKQTYYNVQFKVTLDLGYELHAASLEDALAKAKGNKVTDLLETLEGIDMNDSDIQVIGVFGP